MQLLKWAAHSLGGNMAGFAVFTGVPLLVAFSWLDYLDGTLTVTRFLFLALISISGGALVGVPVWFTILRPLVRRKLAGTK